MRACSFAFAVGAMIIGAVSLHAAEPDPNLQAVQAVCGRCHTTAVFMNKPRSWERCNDVFADMTKRGANGADEQSAQVTSYFFENLTLVNVNSCPADELSGVLG